MQEPQSRELPRLEAGARNLTIAAALIAVDQSAGRHGSPQPRPYQQWRPARSRPRPQVPGAVPGDA